MINRDSEDEGSAKMSLHSGIVAELDWFEKNLPGLKEKKRATGDVLVEKLVEMLTGNNHTAFAVVIPVPCPGC